MKKIYTPEQKNKIRTHPLYIKYSGSVPDELRHLVYPDEAKPEPEKKGKKKAAEDIPAPIETQADPIDGDGN